MKTFGRLLLDALSDPSPWVYSEALNAIFDVFAETQYNAIVSSIGMMQRLEQFVPFLNKQVRFTLELVTYCWILMFCV